MTSKPANCFVYIWLPGATESVTEGRFEQAADGRGAAIGRFVYGKSYLARSNAVPLDPNELILVPRHTRIFETTASNGMFGLPDVSSGYTRRTRHPDSPRG